MNFYEAVRNRRTVRDFESIEIPQEVLERILDAGLRGPSGDHLRDIHYVVIRGEKIADVVKMVESHANVQLQYVEHSNMKGSQREMYLDGVPKQRRMLTQPGTLILPFFRHEGDFNKSEGVTTYNDFASAWCGIENIMLAATAEGLGCSLRIPIGSEPEYVSEQIGAPEGYVLCCYMGVGYPAKDAAVPKQVPVSVADRVHFDRW